MKTCVLAGLLIVAFATLALAGSGAYYVGLRLGGRSCTIITHAPNPKKYKMMGKYGTRAEAQRAISAMAECP
jgi:hypothetical protein